MSLDGFIARSDGTFDWIVMDPAIDFAAMYREYDLLVMGRKTWDVARAMGSEGGESGMRGVVFSRALPPQQRTWFRITNEDPAAVVAELKKQPGKDIWLFGGGELFRTLLQAGLVDTVEIAVMPVLLGEGLPVLPPGVETKLQLVDQKVLRPSGIVMLAYSVPGGVAPASRIMHVRSGSGRKGRTGANARARARTATSPKPKGKRIRKRTRKPGSKG